jgi:hypothetical protein
MKNIIGTITGFVVGLVGFLLLFKVVVLDNVPPEDELAPGIVLFIAIMSGVLFAFAGYLVQRNFAKKNK